MTVKSFFNARCGKKVTAADLATRLQISRQMAHKFLKMDLRRVQVGTLERYSTAAGLSLILKVL